MLNDPNLLRHDIELLTDLGADLDEHMSVVCADAFRFWQLVTHDLAREHRVQRLASTLLAFMRANLDALFCFRLLRRFRSRCGRLRFV